MITGYSIRPEIIIQVFLIDGWKDLKNSWYSRRNVLYGCTQKEPGVWHHLWPAWFISNLRFYLIVEEILECLTVSMVNNKSWKHPGYFGCYSIKHDVRVMDRYGKLCEVSSDVQTLLLKPSLNKFIKKHMIQHKRVCIARFQTNSDNWSIKVEQLDNQIKNNQIFRKFNNLQLHKTNKIEYIFNLFL